MSCDEEKEEENRIVSQQARDVQIPTMQIRTSALALLAVAPACQAFTTTTPGHQIDGASSTHLMMASRSAQKAASRTKWAESRGYGSPPSSGDSSSDAGMKFALDEEKNQLTVTPIKSLDGTVTLPGSKPDLDICCVPPKK